MSFWKIVCLARKLLGTRSKRIFGRLKHFLSTIDLNFRKEQPIVPVQNPSRYVGVYEIDNIQTWNVTIAAGNTLVMTNPQDPGTKFKTVGLSFMNEGLLRLTILGTSKTAILY